MECSTHERGISRKICSHFAIFLLEKRLVYFRTWIVVTFDLDNRGNLLTSVP
jgi:hypothetical protein